MIFVAFLTAVLIAASASEVADSENCVANAAHSEDCVANGSPLMQKAVNRFEKEKIDTASGTAIDTVVRENMNVLEHEEPEPLNFEGFVIDDGARTEHWESVWDSNICRLTMIDPIRPDDKMLNESFNDGTIDRQYKSYYMPVGPDFGEVKFYHEMGVALAHRKAWQTFIERARSGGGKWGLIFEGDATLRADLWRWMYHMKDMLKKGNAPFMIWLGHCFDHSYDPNPDNPRWRDNDFCLKGDENNNPHNVTGCMIHYTDGLCPTAYLISLEGAEKMMEVTSPLNCAIDEKLRFEIQKNNWDARIMIEPLVSQPWQPEFVERFEAFRKIEEEKKRKGFKVSMIQTIQPEPQEFVNAAEGFCAPPGPKVRTILSWPPPPSKLEDRFPQGGK